MWLERTELLIGAESLEFLKNSTVAIVGVGGVGGYAAEMIVRAGVGRVIIVDADVVSESNKNRQLLALDSTMGQSKVKVLSQRLKDINPQLDIVPVEEYMTEENVGALLKGAAAGKKIDFLVDAIDTLAPKIALISYCVSGAIPLVSSMGSGAKFDATKVRIADLSKSYNCPLAYILRKKLRKVGIHKGFKVVFSEELPEREAIVPTEGERNKKSQVGTISYLPPVFGCVCAQAALTFLIEKSKNN
ncbi:MAG: tRNA threonylcarbamoyladenosine dehydratase [Bacteroidales bacterium]|nr:tRNA threonylcarbamoyladenosine dehydratase [Bacteroidales bacterium]MBO7322599.1 tRNA threonylcarbamoyladenosine dehydratase [Bacteroidales bacterium]